jgi:hypothetical protein
MLLPRNLKYQSKAESAMARSSRVNIAPQNGTGNYVLGDTIILNIPTRNNLVLASTESYLKFNCTISSTVAGNAYRWDSCGAHGLIQRIRIFHGSNLIQDIDNYGLLAKILFDLQQATDSTYGKQTLLAGTRSDVVTQFQAIATADATDLATSQALANALKGVLNSGRIPSYQTNSGERIGGDRSALVGNGNSVSDTYCLNLLSLVGSLSSSNYIPLFAMTSAPLRVEIQLVDNLVKACSDLTGTVANPSTISLSNVEYVANFIELGDAAMSVIYGSLEGQPLQYVVPDFRNFQYTFSIPDNTATQVTMPIPAKFSSLKNLIVSSRDKGSGAITGFYPFSSVTCGTGANVGLRDYQFRIGSQIMPPKAPSTVCEFFAEALKAMGSIADLTYQPSIDKLSYGLNASVASNDSATNVSSSSSGSFFIGLDLENYSASPKDTIFAGYNSNTDDIFLTMNYNAINRGAALTVRYDAFANFDAVLVCENNTAYVKF